MSFNRNSDYRRNKNTPDIIYHYAIGDTYRYRKTEDNQILLIITEANGKSTASVVPESEMTAAQFDELKAFSDEDYHETDKRDVRQARNCVSLSGLEDSIIDFAELPEDNLIRKEDERITPEIRTIENAMMTIDACLTAIQKRRYLMHFRDGKTTREIARAEGTNQKSVVESLQAAVKKIEKCKKNFSWVIKNTPSKRLPKDDR